MNPTQQLREVGQSIWLDNTTRDLLTSGALQRYVDGVPINVTLLFSRERYLAAVQAYPRGIEWRLAVGLDPKVSSMSSTNVPDRHSHARE